MNSDNKLADITTFTEIYIHEIRKCGFFEKHKYKHPYVIVITGKISTSTHSQKYKYYVDRICLEFPIKVIIDNNLITEVDVHYHDFKNKVFAIGVTARITQYPDNGYVVALIERAEPEIDPSICEKPPDKKHNLCVECGRCQICGIHDKDTKPKEKY